MTDTELRQIGDGGLRDPDEELMGMLGDAEEEEGAESADAGRQNDPPCDPASNSGAVNSPAKVVNTQEDRKVDTAGENGHLEDGCTITSVSRPVERSDGEWESDADDDTSWTFNSYKKDANVGQGAESDEPQPLQPVVPSSQGASPPRLGVSSSKGPSGPKELASEEQMQGRKSLVYGNLVRLSRPNHQGSRCTSRRMP